MLHELYGPEMARPIPGRVLRPARRPGEYKIGPAPGPCTLSRVTWDLDICTKRGETAMNLALLLVIAAGALLVCLAAVAIVVALVLKFGRRRE